jgi:hypothetical protein
MDLVLRKCKFDGLEIIAAVLGMAYSTVWKFHQIYSPF